MYPLERHVIFHKETKADRSWFELLTLDAAYLHAAVFTSQVYLGRQSSQETLASTRRALTHHSSALRLIQERLSVANEEGVTDATIHAILYLAWHAHFDVDYETARTHMQGLHKVVDLRGGLSTFTYNTKLIMELLK